MVPASAQGRRHRLVRWLLRGWRPRWRQALNLLWAWLLGILALSLIIAVHGGIEAHGLGSVAVAVLVVAVVDAVLRPLLTALAIALSWFGVFVIGLLAQAIVTYIGLAIAPGITVDRFLDAFVASWLYALVATVLGWLLAVDTDDAFIGHCVRQATRGGGGRAGDDLVPGVVFVQLDGVPRPVLEWALNAGNLPTLSRWVRSGRHTVRGWTARVPSTTPVSQAGLLHGSTEGIPAFRWYEKDSGRMLVANRPADAAEIESRMSDGRGLLADDGVSIANLFSGDAAVRLLSMSGARSSGGIGPSSSYASFFTHPFGFSRALILTVGEMIKELYQARRQRVRGVEPRIRRLGSYVLLRGVTNVMLRDLNVALVIEQLMRGAKSIYVDFVDYDEIAHHAGPVRPESLRALEGLDEVVGQLERVAAQAPRPYEFVVLSDHGQSQGATFSQRYGLRLEDLVRELMGGTAQVAAVTSPLEEWGPVNTFLSQLTQQESVSAGLARRVLRERAATGLGPSEREGRQAEGRPAEGRGSDGEATGRSDGEAAGRQDDRSDGEAQAVGLHSGGDAEAEAGELELDGGAPSERAVEARSTASGVDGPAERKRRRNDAPVPTEERPELLVAASGNLGLVYFPRHPGRLTYEEIEQHWPDLVGALANHPGIAFAVVTSEEWGPIAIGRQGIHHLQDGRIDGDDPLAALAANAADDLLRVACLEQAPDIYVNSMIDPVTSEVAAFEELVGCHGGLGGWQTEAMIVHPADWPLTPEPLVGAEAVHRQLVRWLEHLGHRTDLPEKSGGA
ncbi:alkaline phosphatase family protein [Spirillospora sp. NPDC048911]|uniref:alkaline phosphatase family protein n=1 Tax=Spirillospora sp. NPDC048911 TaxID=3364527 RepID=UPI0037217054